VVKIIANGTERTFRRVCCSVAYGDKQTYPKHAKIDAIDPARTSANVSSCTSEAVHGRHTRLAPNAGRDLREIDMLRQFLIGGAVSVCNITIHAFVMTAVARVALWALAYLIVNAVPTDSGLLYFAFVNYTTLGYGDIIHVADWQLLGPMTAMNGVLLFGWSTAVIFEVLRRTMTRIERGGTTGNVGGR